MSHQVIKELSEVLGSGFAFDIAIRWAGSELYVPAEMKREHPISLSIGFEAAQKLSATFGGCRLRMPPERSILKGRRNEAIVAMWRTPGHTIQEIANEFGLSRGAIKKVLSAYTAGLPASNDESFQANDSLG